MPGIFCTSDPHLGHDKEFVYKARGFSCIQEHDEIVIENWNSLIKPDDLVIIAGDVMMGANHDYGLERLRALNGRLIIKRGNHDSPLKFSHYLDLEKVDYDMTSRNIWADEMRFGKWTFYVSHHPTILGDFNCIRPGHKHFCLHGHTHSKDRFEFLKYCCYNVAMDAHNNTPVSIEEVQSDLRQKMAELFESRIN